MKSAQFPGIPNEGYAINMISASPCPPSTKQPLELGSLASRTKCNNINCWTGGVDIVLQRPWISNEFGTWSSQEPNPALHGKREFQQKNLVSLIFSIVNIITLLLQHTPCPPGQRGHLLPLAHEVHWLKWVAYSQALSWEHWGTQLPNILKKTKPPY